MFEFVGPWHVQIEQKSQGLEKRDKDHDWSRDGAQMFDFLEEIIGKIRIIW